MYVLVAASMKPPDTPKMRAEIRKVVHVADVASEARPTAAVTAAKISSRAMPTLAAILPLTMVEAVYPAPKNSVT